MHGWVTIGFKGDTKDLEKEIKRAENELKKFDSEAQKLTQEKIEIEVKTKDFEKDIAKLQEYKKEVDNLHQKLQSIDKNDPEYSVKYRDAELQYRKMFEKADNLNISLTERRSLYNQEKQQLEEIDKKIKTNTNNQELMKEKVKELNSELAKTKGVGFGDIKGQLENIGNSMSNVIHKVAKWGLAVFSIRSAYRFVRQAVSELSQSNAQIGADIEYIKFVLASTLEPIIIGLINLVYKLLAYVNYLTQAWFGINIFARASADAFDKAKNSTGGIAKNVGSAAKEAKELRKQLAGFDEMNVLNDNVQGSGGSGGGVGGGGFVAPSWDLSNLRDVTIPKWLKWIKDNGKLIATIISSIGAALLGWKLATFLTSISGITKALEKARIGLTSFKAGVALIAGGLVLLITQIVKMTLHWDEMNQKQKILAVGLAALGAVITAVGIALTTGLSFGIGLVIAGIVALVATFATLITKLIKSKDGTDKLRSAQEKLKKSQEELNDATLDYVDAVKAAEDAEKDLKKAEKKHNISAKDLAKQVDDGTLSYKNMTSSQREVYEAYLKNNAATAKAKEETEKYNNALKEEKINIKNVSAETFAQNGRMDQYFKTLYDGWKNGKINSTQFTSNIINMMDGLDKKSRETFVQNLPADVKTAFGDQSKSANIIHTFSDNTKMSYRDIANSSATEFGKVKKNINNSLDTSQLNTFSRKWNNMINNLKTNISLQAQVIGLGGAGAIVAAAKFKAAKGAIVTLPKLAVGGVVSRPGQGVNLGNAIIGEAGAEGVIPLTDSQQMALLGEAIGRYITINANITNSMNGRVISREIQKIQNQTDFAVNR